MVIALLTVLLCLPHDFQMLTRQETEAEALRLAIAAGCATVADAVSWADGVMNRNSAWLVGWLGSEVLRRFLTANFGTR